MILHKNFKRKNRYNYQFCSKNEKKVKIVKIIAFSSSAGNQSEEGGAGLSMLIGWERAWAARARKS